MIPPLTPAEQELYEAIVRHAADNGGRADNLMLVAVVDLGWDYKSAYRTMLRLARRAIKVQRRGHGKPIWMWVKES